MNALGKHITPEQKETFITKMQKWVKLFKLNHEFPGVTSIVKHRIDTGDAKPTYQYSPRYGPAERAISLSKSVTCSRAVV